MTYLVFLLTLPILVSALLRLQSHQITAQFFAQTDVNEVGSFPPISILVPVRGLDQGAEANYLSFTQQDYPAPIEVIFALEDDHDPAVPVIQNLITTHPNHSIQLIYSDGVEGIGKIKNQIAASRVCQYDLWVLIDSDVTLAPDFLKSQAASISETGKIGMAYAPPVAVGSQNWVAALHNMAVSASIMNYCRAAMSDKVTNAVGSCIVTRRDVIEAIGGLETIANKVVGLDVSLGQAVISEDYKIKLLQHPAQIQHERDTLTRYWWQLHRWLTTINHYYPKAWILLLILGLPLGWALIFSGVTLLMHQFQMLGLGLVMTVFILEIVSAGVINQTITKDKRLWKYLWLAPFNQLLTFPLLIMSRTSKKVKWRGRWISLESGTLVE